MKHILKSMNAELYGGIKQKVMQARSRLEQSQRECIDSQEKTECLSRENECLHEYISIYK